MRTFRLIGMALLAVIISVNFIACSSDDDEPTKPEETPIITIDSSIITNGLAFTSENGEKSVTFTTNAAWTLSVAATRAGATWCVPSATSGSAGNAIVKFTTTANEGYDDRSVAVTIKSGTVSKTFTITQKQKDAILLTSDKFELDKKGGTIKIEVKANIDYQMAISESAKGWITQSNTRSLSTSNYTFNIAVSEEYEKREGEIYFKSGDKVETVKVYQTGEAVLMLTKDEYAVSDKGETITVDIKSNFEYEVKMPNVDWIHSVASKRAMSSHTLRYTIVPNATYDSRSTQIIYYDKNSSLADTLTIIQTQNSNDKKLVEFKETDKNNTNTMTFSYDSKGKLITVVEKSSDSKNNNITNITWGENTVKESSENGNSNTFSFNDGLARTGTKNDENFSFAYNSSKQLSAYQRNDFTNTFTWENGRVTKMVQDKEILEITYNNETCKGFFPLMTFILVEDNDFKIMLAHPELIGMRATQLPTQSYSKDVQKGEHYDDYFKETYKYENISEETTKFTYKLTGDGYVESVTMIETDIETYKYSFQDKNGDGKISDDERNITDTHTNTYTSTYTFKWE